MSGDTYNPNTDPYDHAWGAFADRVGHAGGYARRAYERAQEGAFDDASRWLEAVIREVEAAKVLLPRLRPMDAETVARIIAERSPD